MPLFIPVVFAQRIAINFAIPTTSPPPPLPRTVAEEAATTAQQSEQEDVVVLVLFVVVVAMMVGRRRLRPPPPHADADTGSNKCHAEDGCTNHHDKQTGFMRL